MAPLGWRSTTTFFWYYRELEFLCSFYLFSPVTFVIVCEHCHSIYYLNCLERLLQRRRCLCKSDLSNKIKFYFDTSTPRNTRFPNKIRRRQSSTYNGALYDWEDFHFIAVFFDQKKAQRIGFGSLSICLQCFSKNISLGVVKADRISNVKSYKNR